MCEPGKAALTSPHIRCRAQWLAPVRYLPSKVPLIKPFTSEWYVSLCSEQTCRLIELYRRFSRTGHLELVGRMGVFLQARWCVILTSWRLFQFPTTSRSCRPKCFRQPQHVSLQQSLASVCVCVFLYTCRSRRQIPSARMACTGGVNDGGWLS